MSSNLLRRLLVAAIGIPAALGIVYLGGWWLTTLVAFFAVAGTVEVYRLAATGGVQPLTPLGLVAAAAFPVIAFVTSPAGEGADPGWLVLAASVWLIAVMAAATGTRHPTHRPLAAVAVTVFAPLYAGALPAFLVVLRHGPGLGDRWAATWIVFLPLTVTWLCDTAAMAGGALIGGPKLAPVLSPKKTWAGAITGTAVAILVAPLYGVLALKPVHVELPWWQLAVFGLVVSVVGQIGDVAESLFKREAQLKDSGGFFPGHGGVLDRFDSLYWVLPTSVVLFKIFGLL